MARGSAARPGARGGERIQARRAPGALIAAVAAVAVAAALGGYAVQRAGTLAPLTGAVVLAALVFVALALAGFIRFLGWGLVLIAAAFMLVDLARTMPLVAAPFYGAGLLLAGELVYASRELARHDEEHARRRVPWLAGVALAGLGIGFVPVAATGVSAPAGFGAELIALAAAALLLGIPALLVRRRQDVPTTRG
jgi:hypothetical protein